MDSVFENAVARFRQSLTKSQKEKFAQCNKRDVEKAIQDIQNIHGSQKRLKYMRRVSKFIEGMSQLGEVIEVFLNVNNGVAFIWGPIKFLLLTANTWIETLDLLLETYADIGEALPGLSQYAMLFSSYPFIQKHLENYYCDVLEFHKYALEVFARPGWKIIFHSSWRTFKTQLGPILNNFKRHQQLLTDEKLTAVMSEVQGLRDEAMEKLQCLENEIRARNARDEEKKRTEIEEMHNRQLCSVQTKLKAPNFHKDHEHATQISQASSFGDWMFVDSRFKEWIELSTFSSKGFYLNGIPGAGKTILVSKVIDYLQDFQAKKKIIGQKFSVVYFYFNHLHEDRRQMVHLLLALLSQLAEQESSLLDFFYREFCSVDQQRLTLQKLCEIASIALRAQKRCFIVIDGLDECGLDSMDRNYNEVEKVLGWFEELMLPKKEEALDTEEFCIRLLISGQRDGHLEGKLTLYASIQLESARGHEEDIRSYAKLEAAKICKQFSARREVEEEIIQKVTTRAKGMFLFAKIVLDNLYYQVSALDFKTELETENFPEGLDKAYERVVKRVLRNPIRPEKLAAEKILGWVISAERPLHWREIQSRFCIDSETGTADISRKPVKSCKYLCGSLVEVGLTRDTGALESECEGEVEIVHSSAKAYLIQTEAISLSAEHAKMASFCAQYLVSRPLRLSLEAEIQSYALTGYYGFHDYATAFWWNHVGKLIEAREAVSSDLYHQTLQLVAKLLKAYSKSPDTREEELIDPNNIERHFAELPQDPRQREKIMSFDFPIEFVRNAIEALREGRNTISTIVEINFLPLYGPILYKCPKPWCQLFSTGFAKSEQRKVHINEHERPFRCSTEGCYHIDIGFATQSGLDQHFKRHHKQAEISLFPAQTQPRKQKIDICTAAKEGNLDAVKDLVANGSHIDMLKRIPNGKATPLMFAVRNGHLDVCEYLLKMGADVNFQDVPNGDSILHAAVRRDDLEIIDLILKQNTIQWDITMSGLTAPALAATLGYDISLSLFRVRNPQEFNIKSCLAWAVQYDQIRTVQMLLKGSKIGTLSSDSFIHILPKASDGMLILLLSSIEINRGRQLISDIFRLGDIQLIRRLANIVDDLNCPDHTGSTPLKIALDMRSTSVVSFLWESGRVYLKQLDLHTSLTLEVVMRHAIVTRSLLGNHPPAATQPDKHGKTPSSHGLYSIDLPDALLEHNKSMAIKSDSETATLLQDALYIGDIELAKVLLRYSESLAIQSYSDGATLLQEAVHTENLNLIKLLLEHDKYLPVQSDVSSDDTTLLHYAVHEGNVELIRLLTEHEKSLAIQSYSDGATLLHRAAHTENLNLIKVLLEHDKYLPVQSDVSSDDTTLLHYAVHEGNVELIRLLTEQGKSLPIQAESDGDGVTLLHDAVHAGSLAIIQLLLVYDTSWLNKSDKDGATPLHYAVYKGNLEATRLLIQFGADVNAVLRKQPSDWTMIGTIDPASITPIRIALEMGMVVSEERQEKFLSISLALVDSDKLNFWNLDPRVDQLALAMGQKDQRLMRSLDAIITRSKWSQFSA